MDLFKGNNGRFSSKRIVGAVCIGYAILLTAITFFASGMQDIPANVQVVSLQFLAVGGGMITAGIFEKNVK